MGYAKRCLLVVALFALLSTAATPAAPQGTVEVDPSEVTLEEDGAAVVHASVINDSVVLSASLGVGGSPDVSVETVLVWQSTTVAFSGGVDFLEPTADFSWYFGDQVPPGDLGYAASKDGAYLTTTAADFAYQFYLVDIDPQDLYSLSVDWSGRGNSTVAATTYWGVSLYIFDNATSSWEVLDTYSADDAADRRLTGGPLEAPWHYVNRTLAGDDRVILLAISHRGFDSHLMTDSLNVTATRASWPSPRVDVGDDGTVEWGFGTGPATGALGHVAAFDDGTTEARMSFPPGGGHDDSASFLVPGGVNVTSAYIDYRAFPSRGERTGDGQDVRVAGGADSEDLVVDSIPLLSHQKVSSVLLTNAIKHNVTEQRQEVRDGQPPIEVGRGAIMPFSAAQTFIPSYTGPLTGIDFFIVDKFGNPGNLTIEIRETNAGIPTGTLLRTAILHKNDVNLNGWNHVPITGVNLIQGQMYAFRLMALESDISSGNEYRLAYNYTGAYADGECFVSTTIDGSGQWTASGFDLAFRTYMDYPIDGTDATRLSVLGVPGTLSTGRVYFNVSGFDYVAGEWVFNVTNSNAFAVTFDWSARTTYLLYAENPSLDVGDDGTVEWTGTNVSRTEPLDITESVRAIVARDDWPHVHADAFGNVLLRVPLNLSVTSEGDVALLGVAVYYNGTVRTSDLAAQVNLAKRGLPEDAEGIALVPLNVSSTTAGTVVLASMDVEYDLPPHSQTFADLVVPEDGFGDAEPLYLDTLVFDDYDNNDLEYTVYRAGGDPNITFVLDEFNALSFSAPPNWSGRASFYVEAEDGRGLTNATNVFNVTVDPVNDAPVVTNLAAEYGPSFGMNMTVALEVLDNDSPRANLTLSADSVHVTTDDANLTLTFLYPYNSPSETVEVSISDGLDATTYSINVTPVESNEPPVVAQPIIVNVSLDSQAVVDLAQHVTDRESDPGDLTWEISSPSDSLVATIEGASTLRVIPLATEVGEHQLGLNVTDPDGNTVAATVTVRITEARHNDPVILRGEDALLSVYKVERGEELVINLALQKYWHDEEDYGDPTALTWEVTSLRPKLFTVSVDSDQRLTITASDTEGVGYMTLRLYDSDGRPSAPESVQVEVVSPKEEGTGWGIYALAVLALLGVVAFVMAVTRKEPEEEGRPAAAKAAAPAGREGPASPAKAAHEGPGEEEGPEEEREGEAPAAVPGVMLEALVIHESTSLVSEHRAKGEDALPDEDYDQMVEMATLFASERFEDSKLGVIKAFKHKGDEVLVGKGMRYFLVTRAHGTDFDHVAAEMKRSMINIDVKLSDRLGDWYPGQRLAILEEELRDLVEGNGD